MGNERLSYLSVLNVESTDISKINLDDDAVNKFALIKETVIIL